MTEAAPGRPVADAAAPHTAPAVAPTGFARLARDSVLFALGAAIGKVVGIILLPVLTRTLTRAEFGRVDVLSTLQSAAASLILLGMDLAATRLFTDLDERDQRRLFSTWMAATLVLGLTVVAAMALFARSISEALLSTPRYGTAVLLTGVAIAGSATQLVSLGALRNHRRPLAFAALSGGTLVLDGALVLVLLPSHPTATTVLFTSAASMALGSVIAAVVAAPHLRARPSRTVGRRLFLMGLPLAPAVAATWIAEAVNRTILLHRAGADEVAYFSVSTRYSSIAVLVVLGFQMAWQPAAFALGQDREALARIADDGRRIIAAVSLAVVAVAATTPETLAVVSGDAYRPAVRVIGFALVFAVGYASYHVATMPSALSRHLGDIGLTAVVAAGAGIALSAWWSAWGAAGTAAAIATGQFLGAGVAVALARGRAPVPYAWWRMALVVLAACGATVSCTWPVGGAPVLVRGAIALAFVVVLLAEGSLREAIGALGDRFGRSSHTA